MIQKEVDRFIDLVERYTRGEFLTKEEFELLEQGMQDEDCLSALDEQMSVELDALPQKDNQEEISTEQQQEMLARFREKLAATSQKEKDTPEKGEHHNISPRKYGFSFRTIAAAVASIVLLLAAFGIYQFKKADKSGAVETTGNYQRTVPIVPGSSGAILTLGNGRKVALGTPHAKLMHIGSLTIQQSKDGASFSNVSAKNGQVLYNTLTTPRGRQFQATLPDGSKVWLNASSTLRFPTVFDKDNRTVELTGEAYFEVVHNAAHPFQVKVNNQLIEDIGTKFNVKAYGDDPAMTTALLEGTVDVSNGLKKLRLTPGHQLKAKGQQMIVSKADLNQILAWKSGFFAFQNASVEEIMRQLSRWYDVDVTYRGNLDRGDRNQQRYTGRIDRNLDLQDLLDGLQFSQLHFKIDQNKRTIIIEN